VVKLTPVQKDYLEQMTAMRDRSKPENKRKRMESIERNILGNYEQVYTQRTNLYLSYMIEYTYFSIWDVISLMLLGMAFFKLGILTGEYPTRFYGWMALIGLVAGIGLSFLLMREREIHQMNYFNFVKDMPLSFHDPARILRTLGIFGLLMFLFKMNWVSWFFRLFRPVGQMAFTNYLTQSIICGLLFNGVGLGLYGKLPRYQAYEIVLAIWVVQIIWSHIWLRYFLYGPFEWVWRQLTYWKKLPIRKPAAG